MAIIAQRSLQPWYKEITKKQWNVLIATIMGWTLDAFDFLIYNFTIISLMKQWAITTAQVGLVVSVTVVASSLGGMIFGLIADRLGRKKALTITVLIYAIATAFCGVSQNLWQLMFFRLFVGLGMGGEWTAGAALISETWPKEHRGKAMSIMQSGYAIGGVIASLIAGPIIKAFGWRPLFYIGIIPALLVFWIRRNVEESEIWKNNETKVQVKTPWMDLFRGDVLKFTVIGTVFSIMGLGAGYPLTTWLPTFLATSVAKGGLGLSTVKSSLYVFFYYVGSIIGYFTFGFLSDRIGRKITFLLYFFGAGIVIPVFVITGLNNLFVFFFLLVLAGFANVGVVGGFGVVLAEIFPTRLRGSGQGFAYNFGRGVASFAITGAGALAMSIGIGKALLYSGALFILPILATFLLPETRGKELTNF